MPLTPSVLYRHSLFKSSNVTQSERQAEDIENLQVQKENVAYHEAGHAFAACLHGCRPAFVYSLFLKVGPLLFRRAEVRFGQFAFDNVSVDGRIDILFAGLAAELLVNDLCNEDLNNPSVEFLRGRVAMSVGSDVVKAIHLHQGTTSETVTLEFMKDLERFCEFFDQRTARAMLLLVPHIPQIRAFAAVLLRRGVVLRPMRLIGQLMR